MTNIQLVARAGTVHWQEIGIENRKHISVTRMHSSKMRTARLLTVPSSIQGGGCLPWGSLPRGRVCPVGCLPRGCLLMGVSAQGCVCLGGGVCPGGVC